MKLVVGAKYLRNTKTGRVYPYEEKTARLSYVETFIHKAVEKKELPAAADNTSVTPEPAQAKLAGTANQAARTAASLPKLNPVEIPQ